MNYITVKGCKKTVQELDPNWSEADEGFRAAVIMLYGSMRGIHHAKTLCAKTGYDQALCNKVAANLRKNGIWQGEKTHCNWHDKENGGMSFMLDVNIALGYMARIKSKEPEIDESRIGEMI